MDPPRRFALAVGLVAIAAMAAFPPWIVLEVGSPSKSIPAGYHFILRGPALPNGTTEWSTAHQRFERGGRPVSESNELIRAFNKAYGYRVGGGSYEQAMPVYAAAVDNTRLRFQALIVAALVGAILLVLPVRRAPIGRYSNADEHD